MFRDSQRNPSPGPHVAPSFASAHPTGRTDAAPDRAERRFVTFLPPARLARNAWPSVAPVHFPGVHRPHDFDVA